jgi:hypothetical protein
MRAEVVGFGRGVQWHVLVNKNSGCVKDGEFMDSWATVSFAIRTVFHGVSRRNQLFLDYITVLMSILRMAQFIRVNLESI